MPSPECRKGGAGERVAVIVTLIGAALGIALIFAALLLLIVAIPPAIQSTADLAACTAVCVDTHLEN